MKKKIYIAGPMRTKLHKNFPAFDAARNMLKAAGWIPISPADLDRLHEGWQGAYPPDREFTKDDLRRFMKRDLLTVEEVNALYMLPDWQQSAGLMVL